MALKDLVIDRDERKAMEIVKPVWHQLWPRDAQNLMNEIVTALRAARNG